MGMHFNFYLILILFLSLVYPQTTQVTPTTWKLDGKMRIDTDAGNLHRPAKHACKRVFLAKRHGEENLHQLQNKKQNQNTHIEPYIPHPQRRNEASERLHWWIGHNKQGLGDHGEPPGRPKRSREGGDHLNEDACHEDDCVDLD